MKPSEILAYSNPTTTCTIRTAIHGSVYWFMASDYEVSRLDDDVKADFIAKYGFVPSENCLDEYAWRDSWGTFEEPPYPADSFQQVSHFRRQGFTWAGISLALAPHTEEEVKARFIAYVDANFRVPPAPSVLDGVKKRISVASELILPGKSAAREKARKRAHRKARFPRPVKSVLASAVDRYVDRDAFDDWARFINMRVAIGVRAPILKVRHTFEEFEGNSTSKRLHMKALMKAAQWDKVKAALLVSWEELEAERKKHSG